MWDVLHFVLTGVDSSNPIENDPLSQAVVGVSSLDDIEEFITYIEKRIADIVSSLERFDIKNALEKFSMKNAKKRMYIRTSGTMNKMPIQKQISIPLT